MTDPSTKWKLSGVYLPPCWNRRILVLVFLASFAVSTVIWHLAPAGWARAYEFMLAAVALGGIAVGCSTTMRDERSRHRNP